MKIVTWNCNGAFRRKFRDISEYDADVYVIQECENPNTVHESDFRDWAQNSLWTGVSGRKGLGIFAKKEIEIKPLDWDSQKLEHFIACRVNSDFNLVGTWCHGASLSKYAYIGQLWRYLQIHKSRLDRAVIAGDFNSNKFWDKKGREWNHSEVVRVLNECEIDSVYHKCLKENQGEETQPTFYFQKSLSKPYHIDYIFASDELYTNLKAFVVGQPTEWLELSDHMPVSCEFLCPNRD